MLFSCLLLLLLLRYYQAVKDEHQLLHEAVECSQQHIADMILQNTLKKLDDSLKCDGKHSIKV